MNIIRNKLWNNVLVVIKLLSIAILSLTYTNSIAASYGFSTTVLNSGNAEWEENYDGPHYNTDFKRNDFSFVMDTAAAIDKLYNYRLHIGIANVSYDGSKYSGPFITNTFGFGVVRNKSIRIWVGPQLGIRGFDSENKSSSLGGFEYGFAAGLNYHISPTISIIAETGVRVGDNLTEINLSSGEILNDVYDQHTFFNLGLLYRFGDDF